MCWPVALSTVDEGNADGPSRYETARELRGRRVERIGFGLEADRKRGVVVRGSSDGSGQAEVFGSLLRLAAGAEELTEAHVSVGEVGELVEEPAAHLVGFVELAGANQVDGVVGHLVELLGLVGDNRSPAGAGSGDGVEGALRRCGSRVAVAAASFLARQQCLYLLPLPQGQGWLRLTMAMMSGVLTNIA
jgi:hypothetical protein